MSLTIIVPCYNEASRGEGTTKFVDRLAQIYSQLSLIDYKLLLVDDGSRDNSVEVFKKFVKDFKVEETWSCIEHGTNRGKGAALRTGFAHVDTDYCMVLDADLSVSPYYIAKVIGVLKPTDCYIGTRYAPSSQIVNARPLIRQFVSFWCRVLVNGAFSLGVSDSQCGFKVFPTAMLKQLTNYVSGSWLYDVEILYNLKCQGVSIQEIPVVWCNMERESTVKIIEAVKQSLKDLWTLFRHKGDIKDVYRGR